MASTPTRSKIINFLRFKILGIFQFWSNAYSEGELLHIPRDCSRAGIRFYIILVHLSHCCTINFKCSQLSITYTISLRCYTCRSSSHIVLIKPGPKANPINIFKCANTGAARDRVAIKPPPIPTTRAFHQHLIAILILLR